MALHHWGLLWAAAGLLCWPAAYSSGNYGSAFVMALYGLVVLASCLRGRPALAMVAAPLLYFGLTIATHAPAGQLWPLCVLLSLQLLGGGSLGALLLCLLTYAGLVREPAWVAIGTAALFSNSLLLGYLRSRDRLETVLEHGQQYSWLGLQAVVALILVVVFAGMIFAGTGGAGFLVIFLIRAVWSGVKSGEKKDA